MNAVGWPGWIVIAIFIITLLDLLVDSGIIKVG